MCNCPRKIIRVIRIILVEYKSHKRNVKYNWQDLVTGYGVKARKE